MRKLLLLFLLTLSRSLPLLCQTPEVPALSWEDFLQEYAESGETEGEETYEARLAWLEELALNPLQLNRASRKELAALPFLSGAQTDSILSYRKRKRGFVSMGELMYVRGVDYFTRRYLSLFVRCDSAALETADRSPSPSRRASEAVKFHRGKHELETRLDVPLYRRKGYETPEEPTATNHYMGNPLRHVIRYRYAYAKEVAYGLTLKKDGGEPVGKRGFYPYDYISGYLMWRPMGKPWSFVAGDYEIRSGRGLLFGKDFFAGREQTLRTVGATAVLFRPHTSTDESGFFRGAAFAWQKGAWKAMAFASYRKLDARYEEGTDTVRSILRTGLHRTLTEISRRRNVGSLTGGAHLGYTHRSFNLALNGYVTRYGHPLFPEQRAYNAHYFRGQTAGGFSLAYGFRLKRISLQGETAADHRLRLATENALVYTPLPRLILSMQCRWFAPSFVSIFGSAVQQGSRVANEQGVLAGFRWLPTPRWELTGYADFFRFPEPTYTSLLPGAKGMEISLQSLTTLAKAGMRLTVRYRFKSRQRTVSGYDLLEYRSVHRARIGLQQSRRKWDWTARADFSLAHRQTGQTRAGWMCSARLGWKPSKRLALKGLAALFFTDDYETALYAYEPQLVRAFAVSAYAYHGWRAVALADCAALKNLTFSLRAGVTHYFNHDRISSGLDEISSSWKTDLSLQLRWVLPARRGKGQEAMR